MPSSGPTVATNIRSQHNNCCERIKPAKNNCKICGAIWIKDCRLRVCEHKNKLSVSLRNKLEIFILTQSQYFSVSSFRCTAGAGVTN